MATADPALLDARVRAAEITLADHYGRTLLERRVRTPGGLDVRVVEYPAATEPDALLPPILLLHGIASVTAVAVPLLASLPSRRVIAVDWPGHGLSGLSVLPPGADLRAHVTSVLDAVLADFGVDLVDVVGHSLGGQFGLYFSVERPERVRRLVLLGAPGAGFGEVRPVVAMRALAVPGLGNAILSLSTSQAAYARNSDGLLGKGALDGYPEEIIEIGYLVSQRPDFAPSVSSMFRALITPFSVRPHVPVSHEELATLTIPVLMVWGDDDVFLSPVKGRASFDAIPGAQLVEVHGGHAPWLNEPARVGEAVSAFLIEPGPTR
jgi:pimeloyl-ACP methyl ester carboxylesterase